MKSAVFDLDGTLADTSGDLIAAANACFEGLNLDVRLDPKTDSSTALQGGRAMLTLGLQRSNITWDEELIAQQYPVLLDFYQKNLDVYTTLYDGVERTLQQLKERGYLLGICTNKPEYLAVDLIDRLGISHYFGALLGADTLPVRKPDPQHLLETIRRMGGTPERAALMGDTQTDRDTSRNANIPSILVTFGPLGKGVSALKPEAIFDHYDELPDVLDRLIA